MDLEYKNTKNVSKILKLYEYELDNQINKIGEAVDVEHIYPQTADGNHQVALDEEFIMRLGNMTILEKDRNIKASNDRFCLKKEHYRKSSYKVTLDLLDDKYRDVDEFTEELIDKRGREIIKFLLEKYPEGKI